jgi:MoxR-like ATPase
MTELQQHFVRLAAVLNSELVERQEEINCALEALVGATTFFMVGEPGVAKSLLARRIHAYVGGGEFFDHDMDKFSTPEDLFGPRSLAAMKEDRWERQITGTLVTADWCMLDEIFEANSALLKTLLRAFNERTFHQGTEIIPMRLTTVLCASNEIPTEQRLLPLYDRLIIRREIRRISGPLGFVTMLATERDEKPEPIVTWADVQLAQEAAMRVTIPKDLLNAIAEIRVMLGESLKLFPSDRRFYEALKVIRAAAWLDECTTAEPEHVRRLENILWQTPTQAGDVASVIDTVLEPLIYRADELRREVMAFATQINPALDEIRRKQLGNEITDKLSHARTELDELEQKAGSARQRRKIEAARDATRVISARVLIECYGQPEDKVLGRMT